LLMDDGIVYNNWVVSIFFDKTEILELVAHHLVTPGAPDLPRTSHAIGIMVKPLTKSLLQVFIIITFKSVQPAQCHLHG
jgi:hypothetical protein